jgi:uncharacterized SAM-binding protein YcdF (DUF218 family)
MNIFESIYRFFGWWIINIDMLFILFLLLGVALLLFKKQKWGKRFFTFSCLGLVVFAIVPIGLWTFEGLENRFPKVHQIPPTAKGMILLGGAFDKMTSLARGETAYTLAGGNFITFVEIAKANPHLQLVFSGNAFEADTAKKEFKALGLDPSLIQFEGNSTNTMENAGKTKELLHPNPQDQWILVTSAYHMPRSTGLFRKAGFNVIPYPVDYHTPGNYEMWFFIGLKMNLDAWHASAREWLGMLINYLMGRSDAFYPKPTI